MILAKAHSALRGDSTLASRHCISATARTACRRALHVANSMAALKVLITGGSSGIGEALVRRYATAGDEVWFTFNSGQARAQALVDELTAPQPASSGVRAFQLDQGSWESLQRLLDELPGVPDVLINNAGLGSATCARVASEKHLQDQALLQVNAVGVLWLIEALLPAMTARGSGKIINIASVGGGINNFPGFRLADGMSKAAVAFMTRQLAAEQVHSGVDIFCVCPGATETPMFDASTLSTLDADARAALIARLAKGRLIDPGEIAELCHFLCSDAGRVLHGAVLDASLGLGCRPGLITERQH